MSPFPNSGTSGNGWTMDDAGGTSGGGTDGFVNGTFVTVADPRSGNRTRTVTASRQICVAQGRTYTFTYTWTAYVANPRPMISVLRVNGVTLSGSTIDTSSNVTSGSRTVTWTATTTGMVTMAFVHTVSSSGGSVTGDDITIANIAGSCA